MSTPIVIVTDAPDPVVVIDPPPPAPTVLLTSPAGPAVVISSPSAPPISITTAGQPGPQGIPGPTGPAGADGGGAIAFAFSQDVAATLWTIEHNLNTYPAVTVIDSAGRQVYGDIDYLSPNVLTASFSSPFSGLAYLI